MIHQRQRLPLRLEAGDDLARVHAGLDDFERHLATNRMLLFLQTKKRFAGRVLPPPKEILDVLKQGVLLRNRRAHASAAEPKYDTQEEVLRGHGISAANARGSGAAARGTTRRPPPA
jgi:hypothetical protein